MCGKDGRKNGCRLPLHPYQVMSWAISLFTIATCYSLVFPRLPASFQVPPTQVSFAVLFSSLSLPTLLLAAFLTLTDPTDPLILQYRSSLHHQYRSTQPRVRPRAGLHPLFPV